jgi:hypothetical protein
MKKEKNRQYNETGIFPLHYFVRAIIINCTISCQKHLIERIQISANYVREIAWRLSLIDIVIMGKIFSEFGMEIAYITKIKIEKAVL